MYGGLVFALLGQWRAAEMVVALERPPVQPQHQG